MTWCELHPRQMAQQGSGLDGSQNILGFLLDLESGEVGGERFWELKERVCCEFLLDDVVGMVRCC
jgi:hypothetical protein